MQAAWYRVENEAEVDSPALLVYPERVDENLRRIVAVAGGVERLRPHVKTHKMPQIIRRQMALGIDKFKCATIAETEMVAQCGARDVMLAHQPVGPKIARFARLAAALPNVRFSTIVDNLGSVQALSAAMVAAGATCDVLLDLDVGMLRSGIPIGAAALLVYEGLSAAPALTPGGLHIYDGHINDADAALRRERCQLAFVAVDAFKAELLARGLSVPRLVAGGTPTFPIHCQRPDVECSPGTCVFWDTNYGKKFQDLEFLYAALVLSRVISKPAHDRLCLDLGYKAIASESPQPRVEWLDLPDAVPVVHSEEHLVLQTPLASNFEVGDALYGVPFHICPTVALYQETQIVTAGRAEERWPVVARNRRNEY